MSSDAGRGRMPPIDSLRGLLLVLMANNHVPSDLRVLSDQPLGYFSAAEGFVFLSGLLAGHAYAARLRRDGLPVAARAAIVRALKIYRAHLACLALVFVWCSLAQFALGEAPPGSPALFTEQPLGSLLAAATFVYRPGLFDILPLYCVSFVALVPLLWALERGRSSLALVVSAAPWAGANLLGAREPFVDGMINTGAMPFTAWQFLFVIGCVLGARWSAGTLSLRAPRRLGLLALAAGTLGFAALRHGWLPLVPPLWLIDKLNLAPLRLLNLLLAFYAIALAVRAAPSWFVSAPLMTLGRNSLAVFSAHVLGAMIVLGLPHWFAESAFERALGVGFMMALMFTTAIVADAWWRRERSSARERPYRSVDRREPSRTNPQRAARTSGTTLGSS